ncbi:MAG: phage tail protein [Deltaproteobacteria bacterium]|jgi:phage tail-like protein|nr:phage tail protein [Deltaproteobacteria bacterium]
MAYPLVYFRYSVSFGGAELGFSEVNGLTLEYEVIRYRDGLSKQLGEMRMPGRPKVTDVTLKKGIFPADSEFFQWITTNHNKLERKDVAINLLDEEGKPKMTWKLLKAWPTKIEGPSFKGDGNEVAIESITLAYEEMTIEAS